MKKLLGILVLSLLFGGSGYAEETDVYYYETDEIAFDVIGVTNYPQLWHRGFPIQSLHQRNNKYKITRKTIIPDIQADFWNGDPDIDAVCRITQMPEVQFKEFKPFFSKTISPFNSQNTFIHRDLIPHYMVIPHIGRMDDIWGGYAIQQDLYDKYGNFVLYNSASVYQDRNEHDLTLDMEEEMIGYKYNQKLLSDGYRSVLPSESLRSYELFKDSFNKLK